MRTSRRSWQALACSIVISAFIHGSASSAFAADRVSGVVVDQSGQPLPRAFVRVVSASGSEIASTLSDERGAFDLPARIGRVLSDPPTCRIEASLSGFATATTACTSGPARLTLAVAPVTETVIVTATRTETPTSQAGASATVFTSADIERRRTPLVADLLRTSPGAMVVRSGAPGSVTSLFVRGGESTYNKVLLDGIPLNEPGGTFFLNNLTAENLDRVEIVRGAQSALFGSDAMASVVQLFTRRPSASNGAPTGTATIEAGSYHTVRGAASVAGRARALEYSFGAAQFSAGNRVPNSDFDNTTLSANVGAPLGRDAMLRFIGRGEIGRNGAPGQTAFGRPDLDAFAKRHDGMFGVIFDQQLTAAVRQRATYSLAASNQQSTNLILDAPYTPQFENRVASFQSSDFLYDSRTMLRRHHASYQADVRLANDTTRGTQLLTITGDWDGERATLEDRRAGSATTPSRDNGGVSVQHQAVWRRLILIGSGRVEHNASFGSAAVPRGSVVFVAREGSGTAGPTRLHVTAGKGIKEPTLLQSFSVSPFFRGNPDLVPERSRSIEAGVDQRLASDRFRIAATWFDNRYRDLISTRTTNPATFEAQYFNIGQTRARGLELSGDTAILGGKSSNSLRVRTGYTFLDSEIVRSTSPSSRVLGQGNELFRRPRHSGFADIAWSCDRASVTLTGVMLGRFVDSDFSSLQPPLLENPGYATWDARAAYTLTRRLSVLLAIDNVANADYMEPLGYQALRRAVRAGLRVGF